MKGSRRSEFQEGREQPVLDGSLCQEPCWGALFCYCFRYILTWLHRLFVVALRISGCTWPWGILVSWPGIKPVFSALQGKFSTTGPSGKSHMLRCFGHVISFPSSAGSIWFWHSQYIFENPWPGIKPVSSASQSRFSNTGPPGKSHMLRCFGCVISIPSHKLCEVSLILTFMRINLKTWCQDLHYLTGCPWVESFSLSGSLISFRK